MFQSLCFRRDTVPSSQVLRKMFELRHEVFYNKLGWEVDVIDGQEIDVFDTNRDPVYVVSQGLKGDIYGSFRLLPTDGPYMLGAVFPELLRGEALPQSPSIWEISRLATSPSLGLGKENPQATLCACTIDMFREGFHFGDAYGVTQYVFVTSVAVERMLLKTGLRLRRFGDGKAMKIGKVLSVACWLDLTPENSRILSSGFQNIKEAA